MRSGRSILIAAAAIVIVVLVVGPFNGLLAADAARGGRSGDPDAGDGRGQRVPGRAASTTTSVPASTSTTQSDTAGATTTTAGPISLDPDTTGGSNPSMDNGSWKGVFLPHGWVATAKSESHIRSSTAALAGAGFTEQIHNVGVLDDSGVVPEGDYAGLARWVAVSRETSPQQRLYAWVNGTASDHVERTDLHAAIARGLRAMTTTHPLDGVILDLEPFGRDDPRYLSLLRAVRSELPGTWIGVTAPLERWSSSYIAEVGRTVDALLPMTYDTTLTSVPEYVSTVSASVARYRSALAAGSARLLPILPAYGANAWHDPAIENIGTASDAIAAAGGVTGAAVYWWWEMTQPDIAAWRAAYP